MNRNVTMERFRYLLKQKIAKKMTTKEADEWSRLIDEHDEYRLISQAIFDQSFENTKLGSSAEKAFSIYAEPNLSVE